MDVHENIELSGNLGEKRMNEVRIESAIGSIVLNNSDSLVNYITHTVNNSLPNVSKRPKIFDKGSIKDRLAYESDLLIQKSIQNPFYGKFMILMLWTIVYRLQ